MKLMDKKIIAYFLYWKVYIVDINVKVTDWLDYLKLNQH